MPDRDEAGGDDRGDAAEPHGAAVVTEQRRVLVGPGLVALRVRGQRDGDFARRLTERLDQAAAASQEVKAPPLREGWRRWLSRGFVAWCANAYLRVAGITGRY